MPGAIRCGDLAFSHPLRPGSVAERCAEQVLFLDQMWRVHRGWDVDDNNGAFIVVKPSDGDSAYWWKHATVDRRAEHSILCVGQLHSASE